MKDLFPGHFKESDKSLKEVWDTSLFVFDANILLNLYRYSDTTRNEFLRILDKIKDRAWLPHRAAEEYLNNRLSVIDQQEKSYDDTTKSIESLKRDLENARQHPFVSKGVMDKVDSVFEELCNELKNNKSVHTTRISSDEIKDSIAGIFENRVGHPYEKERIEQLISEGEERYKQKIPPGFKDSSKAGDSEVFAEKCRKYGDLIVWTQVIDKATELNKGVVLVIDDKKEDWWEKFKGKTVGPRPELVKEFKDRANQTFHMYQADRFLELARENLGEQVSEEIVEEIREVRRRDKLAYRRMKERELYKHRKMKQMHLAEELDNVRHQMASYEKEMHVLQDKSHRLESEKSSLKEYRNKMFHEGGDEHFDDDQLTDHYYHVSKNYDEVMHRLDTSRMKYQELRQHMAVLEQEISHSMKNIEQENAADS
ncbi:MAG: PIN-like domain-containing protein [Gammaproteobacteria bacterium]|nr:PIN-like domain-containing protein [Gammaproteobacteria bacterium]MCF6259819.1 PIN-like domain-containing protein [Gammaproteobacteria bacterium]